MPPLLMLSFQRRVMARVPGILAKKGPTSHPAFEEEYPEIAFRLEHAVYMLRFHGLARGNLLQNVASDSELQTRCLELLC
jgi:hypothetical protein